MKVTVEHAGNLQFRATARGHCILSDQPVDNGGEDAGMIPPEWFLASLGSCVGFYAVKYLQTRGLDTTGLSIAVTAEKTTDPVRLDQIQIDLTLPEELSDRHLKGLEKAVESCIIHNTLTHPPTIQTHIGRRLVEA